MDTADEFASLQMENEEDGLEPLERTLTAHIVTVSRVLAFVTEIQVRIIQREQKLSEVYNTRLEENVRNALDSDDEEDPLLKFGEMLTPPSETRTEISR